MRHRRRLHGRRAGMLEQSLWRVRTARALLTLGTYAASTSCPGSASASARTCGARCSITSFTYTPGSSKTNLPTEIQSRVTTDTTLLQTVIGSSVSIALRNLLMFLGGVVLLVASNPKLSLVVLASAPFVVAPIVLFGRRVRALSRSSQDELARVGSYVGEAFRHIKVVQSFNHEGARHSGCSARMSRRAFAVAVSRIRQRAWLVALVMLLVTAAPLRRCCGSAGRMYCGPHVGRRTRGLHLLRVHRRGLGRRHQRGRHATCSAQPARPSGWSSCCQATSPLLGAGRSRAA